MTHSRLVSIAAGFAARNWRVLVYVLLILASVLLAPEENVRFIYTEF